MKNLFSRFIKSGLAVLLVLILLIGTISFNVSADGPKGNPGIAPLNPAFIDHFKNQSFRVQTAGSNLALGYIPPTVDLSHLNNSRLSGNTGVSTLDSFPAYFDWRNQNKVTPIRDQGQAGTCWAFGTLAALESRIGVVENQPYTGLFDFSEQNLVLSVDSSRVYQAADRANSGGDSFLSTDAMTKWGTVLESNQPYDISTLNTAACNKTQPPLQRIVNFRIVSSLGITNTEINKIKAAIQTCGPVTAAFWVDGGSVWPGHGNMYNGYIYDYPSFHDQNDYYDANHMVCFVGWDDSIQSPRTGNYGAWIVKNSWGTDWGNDGYFYMCYGAGNLQQVGSYHGSSGYEDYDASEHLYYWDEAGMVGYFGYNTNSAWMRSVFTAQKTGLLKSISFWTTDDNVQYQIFVCNGSDGLLSSRSGTCDEMGFYTLPLITPLYIAGGQEFKIDVKITTTTGYQYPLPIEMFTTTMDGGQKVTYTDPPIQTGVCFIKASDQDIWQDASQYIEDGEPLPINVCLRATMEDYPEVPVPASSGLSSGITAAGLGILIMLLVGRRMRMAKK